MKLSSGLPKGPANGLAPFAEQLLDDPTQKIAVVALLDVKSITTDLDTGDAVPTVRVRHIEVVKGDDQTTLLQRIMSRALAKRTGKEVLPLDLEDEVAAAFQGIRFDKTTGEVLDEDES